MGCACHGIRCTGHCYDLQLTPPYTSPSTQVWSIGGVGGFQRTGVSPLHCRSILPLLGYILPILLRELHHLHLIYAPPSATDIVVL